MPKRASTEYQASDLFGLLRCNVTVPEACMLPQFALLIGCDYFVSIMPAAYKERHHIWLTTKCTGILLWVQDIVSTCR